MAGVSEPCFQGGMSIGLTFPPILVALSSLALVMEDSSSEALAKEEITAG